MKLNMDEKDNDDTKDKKMQTYDKFKKTSNQTINLNNYS